MCCSVDNTVAQAIPGRDKVHNTYRSCRLEADIQPIRYLGMLVRWLLWLFQFTLDISLTADIENEAAGAFSRLGMTYKDHKNVYDDILGAYSDLDEDENEATKFSPNTICRICDQKDHRSRKKGSTQRHLLNKKTRSETGHQRSPSPYPPRHKTQVVSTMLSPWATQSRDSTS